jgi:hypothetical protein
MAAVTAMTRPPRRMSKCEPSTGNSIQLRFIVAWNSATPNTL